jgi:hypothetical protein
MPIAPSPPAERYADYSGSQIPHLKNIKMIDKLMPFYKFIMTNKSGICFGINTKKEEKYGHNRFE